MKNSSLVLSLALGGLVLAGCNKEEEKPVPPAPVATQATTRPEPIGEPKTGPTTGPAAEGGAIEKKIQAETRAATGESTPATPEEAHHAGAPETK